MTNTIPRTMHIGHKIKRIRELKGMKQEELAIELGISHQAISKMEQSEDVEDDKLLKVASVLGVTVETIKNFDEDAALGASYFFSPHFQDNATAVLNNFNPLDKLLEVLNENKRLYERMLEIERSKTALLEKLLQEEKEHNRS